MGVVVGVLNGKIFKTRRGQRKGGTIFARVSDHKEYIEKNEARRIKFVFFYCYVLLINIYFCFIFDMLT